MAKFKYKALTNGTLNHPYRFVTAGEIVELDEKINARWLIPLKDANAQKPLPLMPIMNIAGSQVEHITVAPIAPRPDYDAQMGTLIAKEQAQDAAKAASDTDTTAQE